MSPSPHSPCLQEANQKQKYHSPTATTLIRKKKYSKQQQHLMRIYRHIHTKQTYIPPIIQFEEMEEDGALLHDSGDQTEIPWENGEGGGGNQRLSKEMSVFIFEEDNFYSDED